MVAWKENIYAPTERVIYREIAGEGLLVPLHGDIVDMRSLFSLNAVGRYVWKCLDGSRSVSEVVDGISREFDVERTEAEEDIRSFLDELLQADLIVEAECSESLIR